MRSCDMCGRKINFELFYTQTYIGTKTYDLCPICKDKIIRFIEFQKKKKE